MEGGRKKLAVGSWRLARIRSEKSEIKNPKSPAGSR